MKVRLGFVSNSSSSSFTCDFCGNTQSGWDLCLSEAEMVECINDHTFCESHQKGAAFSAEKTIAEQREILLKAPHMKDKIKPDMGDDEIEEMYDEWTDEARYAVPAALCPFCSLDEVTNDSLMEFWFKSTGVTREDVLKQIRGQFADYDEFKAFIKG